MPDTLYNVQLWREHAIQARALSALISDQQTKQRVMAIAAGFERIADLSEKLRSANAIGSRGNRCITRPILSNGFSASAPS